MKLIRMTLLLLACLPLCSCSYIALGVAIPVIECSNAYKSFQRWLSYDHILNLDDRKVKLATIPNTPEALGEAYLHGVETVPLYNLSEVIFVRVNVIRSDIGMRCHLAGYQKKEIVLEVAENVPNSKLKKGETVLIIGHGCFDVDTDLTLLWTIGYHLDHGSVYLVLGKSTGEFVDIVKSLPRGY